MSVWQAFFGWPQGGIWPNLAASVIWAAPALAWHHRRIKRHIDRAVQQATEQQKEASTP